MLSESEWQKVRASDKADLQTLLTETMLDIYVVNGSILPTCAPISVVDAMRKQVDAPTIAPPAQLGNREPFGLHKTKARSFERRVSSPLAAWRCRFPVLANDAAMDN